METKNLSLQDAVAQIKNEDSIAIGGSELRRHPMAAIHEIIKQNKRNLTLFGNNNSLDFDLLIAAECVKEVHSSRVGLKENNVVNESVSFVQHEENTVIERFRAAVSNIEFVPLSSWHHIPHEDEYTKKVTSPFSGKEYTALKAFQPDIAIIHTHKADKYGNVQLDVERLKEDDTDILIAQSAKYTIVTVEQIISEAAINDDPVNTILPGSLVDAVVETPYGAHPCSCDARYESDSEHLQYYWEESIENYIQDYILKPKYWSDYLSIIGIARLLSLASGRRYQPFD